MDTLQIIIGGPQFIGIILTIMTSLIAVAWKTGARFSRIETILELLVKRIDILESKVDHISQNR